MNEQTITLPDGEKIFKAMADWIEALPQGLALKRAKRLQTLLQLLEEEEADNLAAFDRIETGREILAKWNDGELAFGMIESEMAAHIGTRPQEEADRDWLAAMTGLTESARALAGEKVALAKLRLSALGTAQALSTGILDIVTMLAFTDRLETQIRERLAAAPGTGNS